MEKRENGSKNEHIHEYLKRHPGSTFLEISKVLGINTSTLKYHLDRLERDGAVSSKKLGNHRHFYPIGETPSAEASLSKVQRRVMNIIRDDPGIDVKEISKITGLSSGSVRAALAILLKKERIAKVRIGGSVVYEYISRKALKQRLFREFLTRLIEGEIDEATFRMLIDQLDRDLR